MARKKYALDPSIRNEKCEHQWLHYRARYGMPCTGPVVCDMCGGEWETMLAAKVARGTVVNDQKLREIRRANREQLAAMRAWAEYDAANGYDLDDEGNSYHDYS